MRLSTGRIPASARSIYGRDEAVDLHERQAHGVCPVSALKARVMRAWSENTKSPTIPAQELIGSHHGEQRSLQSDIGAKSSRRDAEGLSKNAHGQSSTEWHPIPGHWEH
jgi:hypothetical protein